MSTKFTLTREPSRDIVQDGRKQHKALAAFKVSPPLPGRIASLFVAHWGRNSLENAKSPTYFAPPEFGEDSQGEWRPTVSIGTTTLLYVDLAPCLEVSYREGSCVDHFKPRLEQRLAEAAVEIERRDAEFAREQATRDATAATIRAKLANL